MLVHDLSRGECLAIKCAYAYRIRQVYVRSHRGMKVLLANHVTVYKSYFPNRTVRVCDRPVAMFFIAHNLVMVGLSQHHETQQSDKKY